MKQKEIIKALRSKADQELLKFQFKFNTKLDGYIKFDPESKLYFEITFAYMDYASAKNNHGKYLEPFLNIYHEEISEILMQTSKRSFLGSIFSFKLIGNLMSDIILNPDPGSYQKRNNHNYFKLICEDENDLQSVATKALNLTIDHAIPFFSNLDSIEKIRTALDRSYEQTLPIHNVNNERLRALIAIIFMNKDKGIDGKIERIQAYFKSIDHTVALEELDNLIKYFNNIGKKM